MRWPRPCWASAALPPLRGPAGERKPGTLPGGVGTPPSGVPSQRSGTSVVCGLPSGRSLGLAPATGRPRAFSRRGLRAACRWPPVAGGPGGPRGLAPRPCAAGRPWAAPGFLRSPSAPLRAPLCAPLLPPRGARAGGPRLPPPGLFPRLLPPGGGWGGPAARLLRRRPPPAFGARPWACGGTCAPPPLRFPPPLLCDRSPARDGGGGGPLGLRGAGGAPAPPPASLPRPPSALGCLRRGLPAPAPPLPSGRARGQSCPVGCSAQAVLSAQLFRLCPPMPRPVGRPVPEAPYGAVVHGSRPDGLPHHQGRSLSAGRKSTPCARHKSWSS